MLTQLIGNSRIRCIDVTGQQIGDEGLGIIETLVHKLLAAVAFDGSNAGLSALVKLLEAISETDAVRADHSCGRGRT